MAKNNIQGVTIEFNADTMPVEKALGSINRNINDVNKDLRKVNDALKFNPGDIDQVNRKVELLGEKAGLAEQKVDALKQAQEKMDAAGVDKSSKAYQDLQTELSKTEGEIKDISTQIERTQKSYDEMAQGQKQLSTYLSATGQVAEDLVSIIGTKLVDAYKSGQLGAGGYQKALENIARVTTGSKNDIEALRKVLSSIDDGVDLSTIAAQLEAMGAASGAGRENIVKLASQFSELSKDSTALKTELKQVDEALKLDPSNITLLTDKQDALAKSVSNSEEKLAALKAEYQNISPADVGTEKFRALEEEINKTEGELAGYRTELSQVNVSLTGMDSGLAGLSQKLAQVNQNLNFDVSGLDNLKSKQELLTTAITETENKLTGLRADLQNIDPTTDLGREKFNGLSLEIQNTETQLTGYKTELSGVESSIDALAQGQSRLATYFDATKTSLSQYANILGSDLVAAIESGRASAGELETAINKIGAECTGSEAHVERFKAALDGINSGVSLEGIRSDIAQLGQEASNTKTEVEGLGEGFEGLGSKIDLGNALEGLDGVNDVLGGVSEKLTEFGQIGLEAAQTVEGAQSSLQVKFGQTAEEAEATAEHARNVWGNNFGETLGEVANTMGLVQQSIQGVNDSNIESITTKFQTLIDAGNDEQETVRGVNSVMQAFGYDADTALDLVTKGFQDIPSDELLDNLAEYSPLFAQVGLDGGQMLSVLQAGMESGAYSTDKCADTIKEMGIRMNDGSIAKACQDLGGNFASLYESMSASGASQSEIFRALVGEIGNLDSEEKKVAATSALFGTQGEDSGYKVVQAMAAATNQTTEFSGAANQAVEANSNSVEGMQRKWQDLLLDLAPVGSALADIGSKIIDILGPAIEALINWFSSLDPSIQTFIVAFGAAIAVITPIVGVIAAFGAALAAIGAPIAATIGIIVAIAAAIGGLIALLTNWDSISQSVAGAWDSFCASVSEQWDLFCTDISNAWNGMWDGIKNFAGSAIEWLQSGQDAYWNFINNLWTTCTGKLQEIWQAGLSAIQNIWSTVSGAIQGAWDGFCSSVSNTWNGFVDGVKNIWQQGWNYVQDVVNNVKSRVTEIIAGLVSAGQEKFDAFKNFISDIWNNIKSTAETIWNNIVGTIKGIIDGLYNAVVGTFENIKNKVQEIWGNITGAVGGFLNNIGIGISYNADAPPLFPVPEWHEKGGILTAPTLFAHGGTLHGAGEAGAEAIEPLSTLDAREEQVVRKVVGNELTPVLNTLISEIQGLRDDNQAYYREDLSKTGNVYLKGDVIAGYVDKEIAKQQKLNRRR